MRSPLRALALLASAALVVSPLAAATVAAPAGAVDYGWTAADVPANNWSSTAHDGYGGFTTVGFGAGQQVINSNGGRTWTAANAAASQAWTSVVWGAEAGAMVAVASSGTGSRAMASEDGVNWLLRTTPADNDWSAVTYGEIFNGNKAYVAVASSGTGDRAMVSFNGLDWIIGTSAADLLWSSIAYGNGTFVAVAVDATTFGGLGRVMTSTNGTTWTLHDAASANSWVSVTFDAASGNFIAVAEDFGSGANRVMTSPDGATWTGHATTDDTADWRAVASDGTGTVMALGTGVAMKSTDGGVTWTSMTAPQSASPWSSLIYGDDVWVATTAQNSGDTLYVYGALGEAPAIGSVGIEGTVAVGQELTAAVDGVTGDPTPTLSYQWEWSEASGPWTAIRGADEEQFTVPASMGGKRVRVAVTAANGNDPAAVKRSGPKSIPRVSPPKPASDVEAAVKAMKITLKWGPGTGTQNQPITGYTALCTQGTVKVRNTLPSTARKTTLTVTATGVWLCRVASVSAAGRSEVDVLRVAVK